ncbi:hypothetical protein F2Q69_00000443 [Brassica cretica]|uniref:NB-ARC domain-containing protein n=1 Tax=Brassica cretica TaxID=69181 RepID=A0A8S9NZU4_BRACR|nr:hypothetical protein F2Q69_00000443 [Brassica cretica]
MASVESNYPEILGKSLEKPVLVKRRKTLGDGDKLWQKWPQSLAIIQGTGSDEVRMIGIWGPPGIGKTTIARFAYNKLSNSFQLSVFMDDLKANPTRLCSDDYSGSKSVIGIKCRYGGIGEELHISEKAFEAMSNLQFLKVSGYRDKLQLTGEWSYFPMTCFPCIVNLEFLVELIMDHSKLEKLWEGIKSLRCLKWMDLSYSIYLKELPDLSTATNLEKLDLRNCSSLIKLPSLSGNILEELNIGGCSSLVEFPSFIGNAGNLLVLDLSSFPNLLELSPYVGNATNLEYLNLSNCLDLVKLPLSFGNLQKLQKLILNGCSKQEVLPTNVNLGSLYELDLAGCLSLDPGGCSIIGNALNLQTLNLSSLPPLLDLPSIIENAINLVDLNLSNCSNLVEIPLFIENFQKLQRLRLRGCDKLEVLPTNINLESLDALDLRDCSMLRSFPQISANIKNLNLIGTAIEQVPPSIRSWPRLDALYMSYFENLREYPHALERITGLCLTDTEIQEVPPWVKKMSRLSAFVLKGCRKLVSVPPITDSIYYMDASDCKSLEILEGSFPKQDVSLIFANCFKLNQEARDLIIQNSVQSYQVDKCLLASLTELLVEKLTQPLAEHMYTFPITEEVTFSELLFEFKLESDDVLKIGGCGLVQHLECIPLFFFGVWCFFPDRSQDEDKPVVYGVLFFSLFSMSRFELRLKSWDDLQTLHALTGRAVEERDPRRSAELNM